MDVVQLSTLVTVVGCFAIPIASVVGLGLWTRWLRRRAGLPRIVFSTAQAPVTLAGVFIAGAGIWVLDAVVVEARATPLQRNPSASDVRRAH